MKRGFVTIATGDVKYYKMALNLLLSYKYHTRNPLPFAIIAEKENEYTKLFDKVLLTNEVSHSFMDKFLLLKFFPWDETIFFDADSLAFGDLNEYWEIFEGATDFSSIGVNVGINGEGAWYDVDGIGEYGEHISYKTRVHLGVAYIKKSDSIKQLYNDCKNIYTNYDKLHIHTNPTCYDEVILGIAMPMNKMKAVANPDRMLACYPCLTSVSGDMKKGILSYTTAWKAEVENNGLLVHFGTANTYVSLYRFSAEWLNFYYFRSHNISLKDKLLYQLEFRKIILRIYDFIIETKVYIVQFWPRVIRFLRKRVKHCYI